MSVAFFVFAHRTRFPSQENKITAKNAWSLPLIDHMRDVVREEDEGGDEAEKKKRNKPHKAASSDRSAFSRKSRPFVGASKSTSSARRAWSRPP